MKASVSIPDKFLKLSKGTTEHWLSTQFQDEIQEWLDRNKIQTQVHHKPTLIEFFDINSALKFRLAMGQWEDNLPELFSPVILPLIRRVMPSVIASSIVGVSPMTGPVGSIFALRAKYSNGR